MLIPHYGRPSTVCSDIQQCGYIVMSAEVGHKAIKNVNSHYLLTYTRIFRYIVNTINFQCCLRTVVSSMAEELSHTPCDTTI
jgi:hypothetical protein